MSDKYTYRILTPADVELIYDFFIEIDNMFPESISSRVDVKNHVKKIINLGIAIVAVDNNRIIGIVTGYVNDTKNNQAFLSTLCVINEYQRKGVAQNLLLLFTECAIKEAMHSILLYTDPRNEKAILFYQKNGFVRHSDCSYNDVHVYFLKSII